jgi:hypothetical protein
MLDFFLSVTLLVIYESASQAMSSTMVSMISEVEVQLSENDGPHEGDSVGFSRKQRNLIVAGIAFLMVQTDT